MIDRPAKYFFSYAREDSEFAMKLARDLRAAGADLWLDKLDIRTSEAWDLKIEAALDSCPSMICVLSLAAIRSRNCRDEVSYALEKEKRVVPVLHQQCDIPYRLRRLQYVDFTQGYDIGLGELLKELRLGSAPAEPHPPAGTDASESAPAATGEPIGRSAELEKHEPQRAKRHEARWRRRIIRLAILASAALLFIWGRPEALRLILPDSPSITKFYLRGRSYVVEGKGLGRVEVWGVATGTDIEEGYRIGEARPGSVSPNGTGTWVLQDKECPNVTEICVRAYDTAGNRLHPDAAGVCGGDAALPDSLVQEVRSWCDDTEG